METTYQTAFIVVGSALFTCLFYLAFRYARKKKRERQQLEKRVSKLLSKVGVIDDEIDSYDLQYRILLTDLAFKPQKLDKKIAELSQPIEGKAKKILDFFEPKPKKAWRWYVNLGWYPDQIPERFLKSPKLSIELLGLMRKELIKIAWGQRKLILVYREKMDPKINHDGKKISTTEWSNKMKVAKDDKAERERQESKDAVKVDGAKAKLIMSIKYVRNRLTEDPNPITQNTRYLSKEMVETLCKKALKKLSSMEKKGVDPNIFVEYCLSQSQNFEKNLESWAKKILALQDNHDEIQLHLKQLGELYEADITAGNELSGQIIDLLRKDIPESWKSTDWQSLDDHLRKANSIFIKIRALEKDLEDFMGTIINLGFRFSAISEMEKELKEKYGPSEKPTGEWAKALDDWASVIGLWAKGEHNILEAVLANLDVPLKQRDFLIKYYLDDAKRRADITPSETSSFEKPRKSFLPIKGSPAKGNGQEKDPPVVQEEKPSGSNVKIEVLGIELEVDSDQVGQWQSAKNPKKEK